MAPDNSFYWEGGLRIATLKALQRFEELVGKRPAFDDLDVEQLTNKVVAEQATPTYVRWDVPPRRAFIVGQVAARNEAPFIEVCLRALSKVVDAIVYLDDGSTDGTLEIVEAIAHEAKVATILRNTGAWKRDEVNDRNRMLLAARDLGATHIVVVDADEVFTANALTDGNMRSKIVQLEPGQTMWVAWLYPWKSLHYFRLDEWYNDEDVFTFAGGVPRIFGDDGVTLFSRELGMNAVPWIPDGLNNGGSSMRTLEYGLLHFQFLNWRSFLLKQYYYKCLERVSNASLPLDWITWKYSRSLNEVGVVTAASPQAWFAFDDPKVNVTKLEALADPRSSHGGWREEQVLAWFAEYGRDHFADLGIMHFDWGSGLRPAGLPAPDAPTEAHTCLPHPELAFSLVHLGSRSASYDILFESLAQLDYNCPYELVLVDPFVDHRREALLQYLTRLREMRPAGGSLSYALIKLVSPTRQQTRCLQCLEWNEGFNLTTARVVAMVQPFAWLPSNFARNLAAFYSDPKRHKSLLSFKHNEFEVPEHHIIPERIDNPSEVSVFKSAFDTPPEILAGSTLRSSFPKDAIGDRPKSHWFFGGRVMAMPRSALEEINGFDVSVDAGYGWSMAQLSDRARKFGYDVMLAAGTVSISMVRFPEVDSVIPDAQSYHTVAPKVRFALPRHVLAYQCTPNV
jgi:hypothetical protein